MADEQEAARRLVALRMVQVLPGFGTWASSIRDFETPYGRVGLRQLSILYLMRYAPTSGVDLTPRALSQTFGIQPSVITRSLARLEEQGFIERVRDSVDRRLARLSITEKGCDVSVYVEELFVREMLQSIANIGDDHIDELSGWIETLDQIRENLMSRKIEESGVRSQESGVRDRSVFSNS